jgi:hypothetical protein
VAYFFEPVFDANKIGGKGKEEEDDDADGDVPMPDADALNNAADEFSNQAQKIASTRRPPPPSSSSNAGSKVRGKVGATDSPQKQQQEEPAKQPVVPIKRIVVKKVNSPAAQAPTPPKEPVEGLDSFGGAADDSSSSTTPTSHLLAEMTLDDKKDTSMATGGVVFEPEEVVENKRRRPQAAPGSPMKLSGDESDEKRAKTPPRAASPPLGDPVPIPAKTVNVTASKRVSGAKTAASQGPTAAAQRRLSKNAAATEEKKE